MRKWVWDWFSIWEFQDNTFKPKAGVVATATAKSLQSCPTLCDPTDGSPSGSPVPGILQARTLEWVAISFSNAWKWKVKVKSLSCVRPSVIPWTAAHQAPPSMGFSRQEYQSGVPLLVPSFWSERPSCLVLPSQCKLYKILLAKFSSFPKTTILIEAKHILKAVFNRKASEVDLG